MRILNYPVGKQIRCQDVDIEITEPAVICNMTLSSSKQGIYVSLKPENVETAKAFNDLPLLSAHMQYFEDRSEKLANISACEVTSMRCFEEEEFIDYIKLLPNGTLKYSSRRNRIYFIHRNLPFYYNCRDVYNFSVLEDNSCYNALQIQYDNKIDYVDAFSFATVHKLNTIGCHQKSLAEINKKIFD